MRLRTWSWWRCGGRTTRPSRRIKGRQFLTGTQKNFGSDEDDLGSQTISGINVTPLVDITLVLLIIFMVTATVIVNSGIKVELPKAASGSEHTKTTLAVTITKDGSLYLNGEKTNDQAITAHIGQTLPGAPDLQAIISADRVVPHGDVVHLIDLVKKAGVRRFAINVDPNSAAGGTK
ncbi:MAG: biopolymer transporter ExbD [Deltaproteobacteria bacterium]|nr:biopolymer transporter ExbD [Deltaproteobacteria bacterium]